MAASDTPALVADIGGTNTRVALARGGALVPGSTARFRNAEHPGLDAILRSYLDGHSARPERAAIALAGPVRGDEAEMTNFGWRIEAGALAQACGLRAVTLLNDLQAQGHALPDLPEANLRRIRAGAPSGGTKLVIGLGTGVNAAPVYPLPGGGHLVPPAEAGHIHLSLVDSLDFRLGAWLAAQRGMGSVEDVLAGSGLERLYAFHTAEAGAPQARDAAAIIAAMEAGEPLARTVGQHYVRLLARVVADLGLIALPFGGIYLIGGVARAMVPWFDAFGFEAAFTSMGRFSDLVARFPVTLVEDDYAALSGCARFLATR